MYLVSYEYPYLPGSFVPRARPPAQKAKTWWARYSIIHKRSKVSIHCVARLSASRNRQNRPSFGEHHHITRLLSARTDATTAVIHLEDQKERNRY